MTNNNELKITVPFDEFFNVLNLSGVELEKKRQDLVKADAIVVINGKEHVLLRECAKYVSDELGVLCMNAFTSRSDEDIMNYAFTSLGYLRVWSYFLNCRTNPKETLGNEVPINGLRSGLRSALDDYHKIYEHLRTALEINFGINISANTKE